MFIALVLEWLNLIFYAWLSHDNLWIGFVVVFVILVINFRYYWLAFRMYVVTFGSEIRFDFSIKKEEKHFQYVNEAAPMFYVSSI